MFACYSDFTIDSLGKTEAEARAELAEAIGDDYDAEAVRIALISERFATAVQQIGGAGFRWTELEDGTLDLYDEDVDIDEDSQTMHVAMPTGPTIEVDLIA